MIHILGENVAYDTPCEIVGKPDFVGNGGRASSEETVAAFKTYIIYQISLCALISDKFFATLE